MTDLLGLTLEQAVRILREEGKEPVVIRTFSPGKENREGTARVIRVRENELTVGVFPDGEPGR